MVGEDSWRYQIEFADFEWWHHNFWQKLANLESDR